ncbi:hypothetical protein GCM10027592_52080 [Spirosoma flavus]
MDTIHYLNDEKPLNGELEQLIDTEGLEKFCDLIINWNGRGVSPNVKLQRIREAWWLAQRDSE